MDRRANKESYSVYVEDKCVVTRVVRGEGYIVSFNLCENILFLLFVRYGKLDCVVTVFTFEKLATWNCSNNLSATADLNGIKQERSVKTENH